MLCFIRSLLHKEWWWHTKFGQPANPWGIWIWITVQSSQSHFLSTILFWIVTAELALHIERLLYNPNENTECQFPNTGASPQTAVQKSLACFAKMKFFLQFFLCKLVVNVHASPVFKSVIYEWWRQWSSAVFFRADLEHLIRSPL